MRTVGLAGLILFGSAPAAFAQTFYVDPATGANTNPGLTPSLPWRNPPGARNAGDTGFSSAAWGAITTVAKVPCGATILLRGGQTQTSAQGGAWRINSSYYATNCTGTSGEGIGSGRITIRVATNAEWSGSTGHFTIDGTGVNPTDPTGNGWPVQSLVFIIADSVTLGGISATQRLIVRDSTNGTGITAWWGFNDRIARLRLEWIEAAFNSPTDSYCGVEFGGVDNSILRQIISHDSGGGGICGGASGDASPSFDVGIVDTEIYNNGNGPGNGHHDGFFFISQGSLWIIRAKTHDNFQRGADAGAGSSNNDPTLINRWRDIEVWDNGRNSNNTRGGLQLSGQRELAPPPTVYTVIQRARAYRQPGPGIGGYERLNLEVWHAVSFRNGHATWDANFWHDRGLSAFRLRNSISINRGNSIWGEGFSDQDDNVPPSSNFNLYDFQAAQTEVFSNFRYVGNSFSATDVTFQNAAAQSGFVGANDRVSTTATNYNPGFTNLGGACDASPFTYEACDFTLQSTSDAIDGGTFFLRANGAGTNATTVNVVAGGGGHSDPRFYFVQPASYLGAPGDRIEIVGCGEVTVTSMTASSITFTPACSWSNNAGIHLAWNGAAPDMGAIEFGTSSGTAPAPPTNVRIIP